MTFKVVECHLDIYNAIGNIRIGKYYYKSVNNTFFSFVHHGSRNQLQDNTAYPAVASVSPFSLSGVNICKQALCISAIISRFNFFLSPAPAMLFHSCVSLLKSSRSKLQAQMVLKLLGSHIMLNRTADRVVPLVEEEALVWDCRLISNVLLVLVVSNVVYGCCKGIK